MNIIYTHTYIHINFKPKKMSKLPTEIHSDHFWLHSATTSFGQPPVHPSPPKPAGWLKQPVKKTPTKPLTG